MKIVSRGEFIIQYVLNRALTASNLDGVGAAQEASNVYTRIQKHIEDSSVKDGLFELKQNKKENQP